MCLSSCNRPEKDNTTFHPLINMPPPMRKEFETLLEMVKDAAKYDRNKEIDVSIFILNDICEYIEKYVSSINER